MKALEKILILCGILFWLMVLLGIGNALFSQTRQQLVEWTHMMNATMEDIDEVPEKKAKWKIGSIKSDAYKITSSKWWGFGITAVGGFVDGMVEGYEFDSRTSFERKWGVSPDNPFWGSHSWDTGNNTAWERQFGVVDFYHVADDARKIGYISGGICIGIGGAKLKQKPHHYLYDFALSFVFSGVSKWAGMYYIRHIDAF